MKTTQLVNLYAILSSLLLINIITVNIVYKRGNFIKYLNPV